METTTDRLAWTTGDRLAKARTTAGMSVEQMAAELQVSRRTVSNYENDHTKPSRAVLRVWSEVTGVDLGWILATDSHRNTPRTRRAVSRRTLVGAAA